MTPSAIVSLLKEHGALGASAVLCCLLLAALRVLWSAWHKTLAELGDARGALAEARKAECDRLYQEVAIAQAFERQVRAHVTTARALSADKEEANDQSER